MLKRGKSSKNYFIRSFWRPSVGGKLSLLIEHKPLGKWMSLAQCCEDQLTIPWVKPSKFQRGISIAKVFAASRAFTSRNWCRHFC